MPEAHNYYPRCPEAFVVGLARSGDRRAFEDLVRRRQSSVRNLMRRLCRDNALADDLAQQLFLQVWLKIHSLKQVGAFGGWLRKIAISIWLAQGRKKKDALNEAQELPEEGQSEMVSRDTPATGMDLDAALASINETERMCIALNYQQGLTQVEIAKLTELPLGTVKSHIKRGVEKLRQTLSAYAPAEDV